MSYITKNLVEGETLLFETRHHWIVLLGPLALSLTLGLLGVTLVAGALESSNRMSATVAAVRSTMGAGGMAGVGGAMLLVAIMILSYGLAKRNATEMGVTNRRVLIKTGLTSRRTLDMMLSKVESIAVDETFWGRMFGYGSVMVRGTGGTPESFVMIAHPQQFRQAVQQQVGKP